MLKIVIIPLLVPFVLALFGNRLKAIKEKAKNIYNSKYGKDKTWHYLGYDLSEYPGTNAKYRQINTDKWNEYYQCLKRQENNLNEDLSVVPDALQAFQSNSIQLECKVCRSPMERDSNAIRWYFAAIGTQTFIQIETTEHIFISPFDQVLHLYNLQTESTGQYLCNLGNALIAPYFLTVLPFKEENMLTVHTDEAYSGPYAQKPEPIPELGITLDTEWSPWSACSRCNQAGKRHRLGYCTIYLADNKIKLHKNNYSITGTHYELLRLFENGIPCKSHILPSEFKQISQIVMRKDEIMTGFCKIKCPQNKIFEVKDKNGNIIEKVNNSAGIYSVLQGMPPITPEIEHRLQYEAKGKDVTLTCPGNLNSDVPIHWQIQQQTLVPDIIAKESNGRISITISDRLHIKNLQISDSNLYSCWQQTDLAGVIRLVVEKRLELNFNHHIMLLGIVVILSIFLYIMTKAFFGRKYAKI